MEMIAYLNEIDMVSSEDFGGKAFNLHILNREGFPVLQSFGAD